MKLLYNICYAISLGIVIGVVAGGIKACFYKPKYSEHKVQAMTKLINKAAAVLKYVTFTLLILGLIWCSYFLILGIYDKAQVDYANNMAELIVSILTVISILFAFVEFIRKKENAKNE